MSACAHGIASSNSSTMARSRLGSCSRTVMSTTRRRLDQDVEHVAVLVDGSPQPAAMTTDA